ncbi:tRNA (N6-isopentenyl adenosine(37)-C2)-methylthiotransferase MiaB [Candidatus Dependentiae bacterium]|nr:tRNA (N6-isopentenyl adenosine(37)-C2)-methylthiotransferase MiaB [Candidatus Dependentiae bacterium]
MVNFYIKTYGCQANVADSQAISNFLEELNCKEVKGEIGADLILINTCAIREKAEQKVYSYIGGLIKLKEKNPHLKIIIVGCIATYRKKEFYSRFPSINFVSGAKENKKILLDKLIDLVVSLQTRKQIFSLNNNKNVSIGKFSLELGGLKKEQKLLKQSFINIMTGCNNFCSYCIVPFTRGREISYSSEKIIEKIKMDVNLGAKEITLLGQNVNSYKDPKNNLNFAQLLEKVANIKGDFWVRFMSPHPKDMTLDVIKMIAKYKDKLCPFIHHPLQSGSNNILKAMKREYTVEKYLKQIEWIHKFLPMATISTDIIVGFPGETEDDFRKTMDVIQGVKFDNIFSFIYSPRKYTKAALLKDNCSYEEKQKRLDVLQKRQVVIARSKNETYIGKTLKCLVEKRTTNGKLLARSAGNHRILFNGKDSIIDTFVNIKVKSAGAVNLTGSLN